MMLCVADEAGDREREERLIALVEDRVRTELVVTNGMLGLGLSEEAIGALTEGVVAGLDYAFRIDWAPDWVRPGKSTIGNWTATTSQGAGSASSTRHRPPSWMTRSHGHVPTSSPTNLPDLPRWICR